MATSIHNGPHESFCFPSFQLKHSAVGLNGLVLWYLGVCTGIKMRGATESYKVCVFATNPDLL